MELIFLNKLEFMKKILVLSLALSSFSAFAGESVSSTIERIEFENNVKCELVKNSMGFCFGTPAPYQTCYRSATYRCLGAKTINLKLKIKDFYNLETNQRESVVRKIIKK